MLDFVYVLLSDWTMTSSSLLGNNSISSAEILANVSKCLSVQLSKSLCRRLSNIISDKSNLISNCIGRHFLVRQFSLPRHWPLGLLLQIIAASRAIAICIPVADLVTVLITRYVAFLLRAQIDAPKVNLADFTIAVFRIVDVGRVRGEDTADSDTMRACIRANSTRRDVSASQHRGRHHRHRHTVLSSEIFTHSFT